MILCKIKKCLPFNAYLLEIEKGQTKFKKENTFELVIEFYGMDKPKENSYLLINEKLLDKNSSEYTQPYSFELCKTKIKKEELIDSNYAILKVENKNLLLKRICG